MAPLKRFVTVHKDRDPFELVGSVVVTSEFTIMRTNVVRTEDFVLEAAASPHERQPPRSQRQLR